VASYYTKQMQQIVDAYRASDEPWPATAKTIAAWALDTGRWSMPKSAVIKRCAEDIADAMREEYIVDSKGRRARRLHPATITIDGEQRTIWDDILTAPRSHMQISFQQRRRSIVGDCRQFKTDVDCYNEAHVEAEPIEVDWDFTMDLLEWEAASDVADEAA
jgi:hypothetical protein